MHPHALRDAAVACVIIFLGGCGGGGGGADISEQTPTGPGNASPPLSVSSNAPQVSVVGDTAGTQPSSSATFVISNIGATPYFASVTQEGSAVAETNLNWFQPDSTGAVRGQLTMKMYRPNSMGAGTYTDRVTVNACLDSACTKPIPGSPLQIPVTYTVLGNPIPSATFSVSASADVVEAKSVDTAAKMSISFTAYESPAYGLIVRESSQPGGIIASLQYDEKIAVRGGYHSGEIGVNFKSPNDLGPGIYHDVVTVSVCYDEACTKSAVAGPWTFPVTLVVTASAGREYQVRSVQLATGAIATDASGEKLWVLLNGDTPQTSKLAEIDPTTGATLVSKQLDRLATRIVPSTDGRYVYLACPAVNYYTNDGATIKRVRVSDLTVDLIVAIPWDDGNGGIQALEVSPTNSDTIAVSYLYYRHIGPALSEVVIYDRDVARPNNYTTDYDGVATWTMQWSEHADHLYVSNRNVLSLPVAGSGLGAPTTLQTIPSSSVVGGALHYSGGLLYADGGGVMDPVTGTLLGQYKIGIPPSNDDSFRAPTLIPPASTGRAFAAYNDFVHGSSNLILQSFQASTRQPLQIARLNFGMRGLQIARFGRDGLAVTGDDLSYLYFITGPMIAP